MSKSIFERLRLLEEGISEVRKTKQEKTFTDLQTLEEISIIRQAKREHLPIRAEFSGKAFINLDDDALFRAYEDKIIDHLIDDTPLLKPFLQDAVETFKLILPSNNKMKIFVIILNWNGKEDTLHCLESLGEVSTPHKVVIVDNGSTDGSASVFAKRFPKAHLIETRENLGYAEGNNVGIRFALEKGADYIFVLNNDTIVTKDILEKFLERDAAVQGGKALLMDDPNKIDHLGGNWNVKEGSFELIGLNALASEWHNPISLDYVCGVALFVKAEVFKKIGLFDPRFFLFWEESDWCYRAKAAGYPVQVCPEATLFHKKSASFTGGKPHTCYFWWRNRLLWIEKNCPPKVKRRLRGVILRDYCHTLKLLMLKLLQYPFAQKTYERRLKIKSYRALLAGIRDYFFRRFGNCPSWLFKPIQ